MTDAIISLGHSILISAVRGCDGLDGDRYEYDVIKAAITGRIRWIVFRDLGFPGVITDKPMGNVEWDHLKATCHSIVEDEDNRRPNSHFLLHLISALRQTRNDPIWGGHADKIILVLENTSCGYMSA